LMSKKFFLIRQGLVGAGMNCGVLPQPRASGSWYELWSPAPVKG